MNKDDIPENSINISLRFEGETPYISSYCRFSKDCDPEVAAHYKVLLDGLLVALDVDQENLVRLANAGYSYSLMLEEQRKQEEQELMDEIPDADNLIKMRTKGGIQ